MTTLVTGASGHLGANVIRALCARGRSVQVLVHRDPPRPLAETCRDVVSWFREAGMLGAAARRR